MSSDVTFITQLQCVSALLAESLEVSPAGATADGRRRPGVAAPCDWSARVRPMVRPLTLYTHIIVTRLASTTRPILVSYGPNWTFASRTLPEALSGWQRRANLRQQSAALNYSGL